MRTVPPHAPGIVAVGHTVDGIPVASFPSSPLTLPTKVKHGKTGTNGHADTIAVLDGLNDPYSATFEPTVSMIWDWPDLCARLPRWVSESILERYTTWARTVVRHPTDVVMLNHLLLYFTTSIPSALLLYRHFSYVHGLLHLLLQGYYMGTYTLMMHQHIHGNGILARRFHLFDACFPYVTDPLMGHTWNSYYFHHVKHHHVEGNGPNDLSSTLRYQRDSPRDFAIYVGRFILLTWLELPLYFLRRKQPVMAIRAAAGELGSLGVIVLLARFINFRATLFTLALPLMALRLALMVGNWGQHAFVDEVDPDSDYRSSITLLDVASNRHCFNDGYHTSHHLNPRRHWREHPVAFLRGKEVYAAQHALVFRNIDYVFLTIHLLKGNYEHIADCLLPMGEQVGMDKTEVVNMLKRKTRKFSEEEIRSKFGKPHKA